ncbi:MULTISPECIES: triple tyrosine motif-containing protein [unclassified Algibacter]|uniref:helix-turn-helix and ligand-binding sensor domain-containing protein n=1 Tax=unclassified Algibacter TaxID=2615009 RepID=UPI00131CA261|nr:MULTISPECIES: triple tyrosine motif-containing protein [unclassified Algibacter]MCL5127333.1 LuxR C-terminal-related transcriptional regulator [Algibacter sp. L4_22]
MKKHYCFLFCFCIGLVFTLSSQEFPPIQTYTPEVYGGENQNWSISQSSDKYLYFANNKGLLEFSGAKWNLYHSPNETILRTVKVIDSLIYTGSFRGFGYWEKDDFGLLNYTPLSKQLNVDFLEDEEIWTILKLENWILFQSLDRIHIYDQVKKTYSVVDSESKISRLFLVGKNLYFQNVNKGLYQIENGKGVLVSDDAILQENLIVNIFKQNQELLILTQDRGFFKFIDGALTPWDIADKEILDNVSVFSGIQLQDKSFVLGTISDGLIHLTYDGSVKHGVNQSNGLSNNTVLSLFEDEDHNIWLGLDNGIDCINSKSPYLQYIDNNGIIGSVYTSKVYNGLLYLGSNQGLFCKPLNSSEDFQFVPNTQGQVWCLEILDNQLFCGHNSGTFLIEGAESKKISNVLGAWQIKKVPNHENLLIQGNYNGLNILEKINESWQFRNKIEDFNISSRYFEFLDPENLIVSHEYKGVFNVKVDSSFRKTVSFKQDTLVEKGLTSSFIKYNDDLLYTTKKGVFKYQKAINRFQKDTLLSKLINGSNYTSGKLILDLETDKLWSLSTYGLHYLTAAKLTGEQKIETISFPSEIRKDITGFENITNIVDEQFLVGSATGYFIFDLKKIHSYPSEISINQVEVSASKIETAFEYVNLKTSAVFKNKKNNVKFTYSIPQYLKIQKLEYQYKLEGIYDTWSHWSSKGEVVFENLPYGDYSFVVRGRIGDELTLNSASYAFKIERPLLLSNIAIASYIIAVLLFSLFMHTFYKRYYKNQRERLLQKTTREFELKELENNQKLMRFKNDKLREDIEAKNRELGVSTMSLIKKNEFLNSLKKELEDVEGSKTIKQVIKIIDKNINHTDDWNLFQEAFNNADKDFLKKIKGIHPKLTSNDLRLCAYLRLNLSSKEIAPLLNISHRSVEVKRYRLRKKMELPHETSLTNYILEL